MAEECVTNLLGPPPLDLSPFLKPEVEEKVPVVEQTAWKADAASKAALQELATAESMEIDEGIEVIPLNSKLLGDNNASSHLVTRREQRDVVDFAFKVSRENLSKYSVTISVRGSPGIGKSWSLLLYIRKLMKQTEHRRPIIFERGQVPG